MNSNMQSNFTAGNQVIDSNPPAYSMGETIGISIGVASALCFLFYICFVIRNHLRPNKRSATEMDNVVCTDANNSFTSPDKTNSIKTMLEMQSDLNGCNIENGNICSVNLINGSRQQLKRLSSASTSDFGINPRSLSAGSNDQSLTPDSSQEREKNASRRPSVPSVRLRQSLLLSATLRLNETSLDNQATSSSGAIPQSLQPISTPSSFLNLDYDDCDDATTAPLDDGPPVLPDIDIPDTSELQLRSQQ